MDGDYNHWDDALFRKTLILGSDTGKVDSMYYSRFKHQPTDSEKYLIEFQYKKHYLPPAIIKTIGNYIKKYSDTAQCHRLLRNPRFYQFRAYYPHNKDAYYCQSEMDSAVNLYIDIKKELVKQPDYNEETLLFLQDLKALVNTTDFIFSPYLMNILKKRISPEKYQEYVDYEKKKQDKLLPIGE